MTFQIKDIQAYKPIVVTRKFDTLGLVADLEIKETPTFKNALRKFQVQFSKMSQLSEDDFLAENNSEQSLTDEKLMLLLIGEYMIKSWNADKGGELLEPSYHNLKMVAANYERDEDMAQIVSDLFATANDMINEFSDKVRGKDEAAATTKKKPSRCTTGTKKAAS